jgi:diaminohydroxyphosphoribosylaminopyrimidine deaminase/5-amino-6-(5-phosphoribosylamino)uracil reductase
MGLALLQANVMLGNTKDNPSVGCVIAKNNNLISAGATSFNGRPHAEVNAINFSKYNLKNSYIYTTLEPCSHYGKTPPCVKKIISRKVKRVFFSINDPDDRSYKKSKVYFKKERIIVRKGLLQKEVNFFYKSYFNFKKQSLPFVTSKLAISRDFFTINKKSKNWITNQYSRGRVHLLRSSHDCIVTSSRTIIKDNPSLNCRIRGLEDRSPLRIVLDKNLNISIKSKILRLNKDSRTIIFYNEFNKRKILLLKRLKIETVKIPLNNDGNLDLVLVLKKIKEKGFSRVFLECGEKLTYQFLKKNLINDFKLFISKKKLGKSGGGSFRKNYIMFLKNKKGNVEKVNLLGDQLISYRIK